MIDKIRRNDEGSLLLSTFHLLLFISFLIISLTAILQHQMMQLELISQAYEAKALIEVSEVFLRERLDRGDVETGTIYFNEGRVDISKETDRLYTLVATMPNHYTSRRSIDIPPVENLKEPEVQALDEEAVIDYSSDEPVSLFSSDSTKDQ